jgi:hypothetical protein
LGAVVVSDQQGFLIGFYSSLSHGTLSLIMSSWAQLSGSLLKGGFAGGVTLKLKVGRLKDSCAFL